MTAQNEESTAPALKEMSALKSEPPAESADKPPSMLVHVLVFAGTATAAFLGYTLLF